VPALVRPDDNGTRIPRPGSPSGPAHPVFVHPVHVSPPPLRTAIVLRELEGLSYEDIAQTMDCPVGTVRSRIFRAREAIDKKLRPIFDGGLGRPEDT